MSGIAGTNGNSTFNILRSARLLQKCFMLHSHQQCLREPISLQNLPIHLTKYINDLHQI